MLSLDHVGGATPSMAGLQLILSKEFSTNPEKIEIKNISSLKGRQHSNARIFVWEEDKTTDLSKPKEAVKEEGS